MIATAAGYEPYAQERRVGAWALFRMVDTAAAGNSTPSVSNAESMSNLKQLTDGVRTMGTHWATLEDDDWVLGTECRLLSESYSGQIGWWSSVLSNEKGVFTTPPTLTFRFSAYATSAGFMLFFDDAARSWPTSVKVVAYHGTSIVAQGTFAVTSAKAVFELGAVDYNKVIFTFLTTNAPYRRVRVCEALFGVEQSFDADSLVSVTWKAGASVGCESLQTRELVMTFDNSDHKYNMSSPNSVYSYLQDGQVLETGVTIGGVDVSMGEFYFNNAAATDSAMTATITAYDKIYRLDSQTYDSGEYGQWTLAEAIAAIAPGMTARIPSDAAARIVRKCIPVGTTRREALRLSVQAAMCSCWIDRTGVLVVAPLAAGTPSDTLDLDRLKTVDNLTVSELIDRVVITADDSFEGFNCTFAAGTGQNEKTISNPCVDASIGNQVAAWLLSCYQRRARYSAPNRGNPAVEVGDTITIYDAFGGHAPVSVTETELVFDGGLSETTKGVGA